MFDDFVDSNGSINNNYFKFDGRYHRLNEINTMIALAKERREGVLGSIDMMTKVYESTKPEPQPTGKQ